MAETADDKAERLAKKEMHRGRSREGEFDAPRTRTTTAGGGVRLPGAALLILIGLVVLYLATSGQLDRVSQAWDFVKTGKWPAAGAAGAAGTSTAAVPVTKAPQLLDTPTYHVEALMFDSDAPGGMF